MSLKKCHTKIQAIFFRIHILFNQECFINDINKLRKSCLLQCFDSHEILQSTWIDDGTISKNSPLLNELLQVVDLYPQLCKYFIGGY